MNFQQVGGDKLLQVANRIKALQKTVSSNQINIGQKLGDFAAWKKNSLIRLMSPNEFAQLFPNPPATTLSVSDYQQIIQYRQISVGGPWGGPGKLQSIISVYAYEAEIRTLDDYFANLQKPQRQLTQAEFDTLYQPPSTSTETAAISAAQAEANALTNFLKSGPYPQYPAQYDVDLLTGTAITFP